MNNATDIVDEMSGTGVVIENRGADTISLDQIGEGTGQNISTSQSSESIPLSRRIKGISLMVPVSLFVTLHGSIVKHLKHIAVGEVLFIAGIYSVFFFSVTLSFVGAPVLNLPLKVYVHFFQTDFFALANIGKVWSLQNLPLRDATALFRTAPLFTGVIARISIQEMLTQHGAYGSDDNRTMWCDIDRSTGPHLPNPTPSSLGTSSYCRFRPLFSRPGRG